MSWLLLSFLPLLIFVIADIYLENKYSILITILVYLGLAGYLLTLGFKLDIMIAIEFLLLVGLGLASIKLQKTRYFKLQPAIVNVALIILMTYNFIASGSTIAKYIPQMRNILPEENVQMLNNPAFLDYLIKAEKGIFVGLIFHAILMYIMANKSNGLWIFGKAMGIPLILAFGYVTTQL